MRARVNAAAGKTRRGNRWIHTALVEAGGAAGRTKHTALGARYRRLRGHLGHGRAVLAVGRNILEIAYYLLSEQNTYRELGIDYFDRYRAERLERTPPRRSRKIFRTATPALSCGCHRAMRPEEGAHVTHRQRNPVLGLFPRVEAHLSLRREKHSLHGYRVGVRRDIVREN
jgi:hypothetical protein